MGLSAGAEGTRDTAFLFPVGWMGSPSVLFNFSHGVLCSWFRRESHKVNVTSISFYGTLSGALIRRRDFQRQNNELNITGIDQAEPPPRNCHKARGLAGSTEQPLSKEILRQKVITYSCFINTRGHSGPLNTVCHFTSFNSKVVPFAHKFCQLWCSESSCKEAASHQTQNCSN